MSTNDKIIRRSVPLASADFDSIKKSLKEFLKECPDLVDYDFDGSMTSILLDELALNSHINAFYLNMVGNEAFLKTAIRRDSIVARAEALNYTPSSIRSAVASVYIKLNAPTNPQFIDIPKYTAFVATGSGVSFTFYNTNYIRVIPDSAGQYIVPNIEIVEGKFLTHRFTVDANIIEKGVIIPNVNVDYSKIEVSVAENVTSSNFETFTESHDVTTTGPESQVYFVREMDGFLNVYFGDGYVGKKLVLGSVIKVIYPISNGPAANGLASFTLGSALPLVASASVVASGPSFGGADAESLESIKLNAPRFFETQNRAVTAFDYESLIKKRFPNYDDVIAWGGEENIPVAYGKVFLAIKPASGFYMTQSEKNRVVSFLRDKKVVSITPVVTDAEYIFIRAIVDVQYDQSATEKMSGEISSMVSDRVLGYSESSLSRFDKTLRKSVLSRIIDMTDPSILSNTSHMTMEKRYFPEIDVLKQVVFTFNNPVEKNSFTSSKFTFNGQSGCFFQSFDESLKILRRSGVNIITVMENAGTIDYLTGTITSAPIEIDAISQSIDTRDETTGLYFIAMKAIPAGEDISTGRKQIVQILSCKTTAIPVSKSDI